MPLERINPAELATPQTYTHVIVATGRRLVFVARQVAEDGQGNLVGPGDLAVQDRQAFENVGRALAAARARPEQVTKITIFVVIPGTSTCQQSKRAGWRCSGITSRPTR